MFIVAEDLLAVTTVDDVQMSPRGDRVAYVVGRVDRDRDANTTDIWIVGCDGGEPLLLARHASQPRWSADGNHMVFLNGGQVLSTVSTHGGQSVDLFESGRFRCIWPAVWSPDGQRIAFAALETAADATCPRVVPRLHQKMDGFGYWGDACSQLYVLELSSRRLSRLSAPDERDLCPAWSADGASLAFCRERRAAADLMLTDLWLMGADGQSARRLTESVGRAVSPAWSPDGRHIACYGTDKAEGYGDPAVRVWLVPLAGRQPRALTRKLDRAAVAPLRPHMPPPPRWSPHGKSVTFVAADAGNKHVIRVDTRGQTETLVGGRRQITSFSQVGDQIAFAACSPLDSGNVHVGERPLTTLGGQWRVRVEQRAIDSPHGGTIDGWLFMPPQGQGPWPLLLDIHGGPHSYFGNDFAIGHFYRYVLASRGWTVLATNPHGSGSYSKRFAHSLRGRWGEYDMPEQMAAVDAMVAEGVADARRLAVTGYSYGGFMTSWIVGHTDRFRAAVVGGPVTNLESFSGTSDIGPWFAPFEGGKRLRHLSPVRYADRVTTPTLIMHGEADDRCPIGQAEELYAALVTAGRVAVQLVRYPQASHMFYVGGRPSHRVEYCRRLVEWVEKHTLG